MTIRTSYGAGPYQVDKLSVKETVYCNPCGREHAVNTLINMDVWTDAHGKRSYAKLEGFHVVEGEVTAKRSPCLEGKPGMPEPNKILIEAEAKRTEGYYGNTEDPRTNTGSERDDDEPLPMPHWREHDDEPHQEEESGPAKPTPLDCTCPTKTITYHGGNVRDAKLHSDDCPFHGRKAPAFDLAEAIAENEAIAERAAKAEQAARDKAKAKGPRPYAWEFDATFQEPDGEIKERSIARVGGNPDGAAKSAMRAKGIKSVRNPRPLTEDQYSRCYGARRVRSMK